MPTVSAIRWNWIVQTALSNRTCLRLMCLLTLALTGVMNLSVAGTPRVAAPSAGSEIFYHVFVRSFRDSNRDRIGDLDGLRDGLD